MQFNTLTTTIIIIQTTLSNIIYEAWFIFLWQTRFNNYDQRKALLLFMYFKDKLHISLLRSVTSKSNNSAAEGSTQKAINR